MNNFTKVVICMLIAAILFLIIVGVGGCRVVQPVCDFLFVNPNAVVDNEPGTPQEQLLNAAKGTNWLVAFSILGIGAGVFAFVNGSKIGIPVVVACAVSLFMALAVARFAMWMAVFGMVGACAAVAISVIIKNKALREVVTGVQSIKESAGSTKNKKNLQEDISTALLKQTNSTKKLISKIRAKL